MYHCCIMKYVLVIFIALCITFLQVLAFIHQIDGQVLSLTIASLAGILGYTAGAKKNRRSNVR